MAAIAILIALCFIAFAPAMRAYFIADDYVPIAYLHQGFHGHFGELFGRLFQPWQDATVQLMYRPVIELTMMLDYALWGANPVGVHVSNVLWHAAATVGFYFVCKELMARFPDGPRWLPLVAGALFATTPLHSETVAWMIGRVDSVCATFYFGAMYCYLRSRQRLALVAFWLALLSKEMAVTLPAVLVAFDVLVERKSIRDSLKRTAWYWASVAAWFCLRVAVLGTPFGGYIGSVGASFARLAKERFLACRWDKIFYPFSDFGMKGANPAVQALRVLYGAFAVIALLRWRRGEWAQPATRLGLFAVVWLALCMLPAVPVWYLNSAVTGGRFLYFGSAPLLLLLALLLMAPRQKMGALALAGMTAIFCVMSCSNMNVWVASGDRAKSFHNSVEAAVEALPADQKLVLVNTPKQANDEPLFYTSEMWLSFFKPPFSAQDLSGRLACTQPNFYIPDGSTNASLLRRMAESGRFQFFAWDDSLHQLHAVSPEVLIAGTDHLRNVPSLRPAVEEASDSFIRNTLAFSYDVSMVPNIARVVAEVTKPNCCFVHYTRTFRDLQLSSEDGLRVNLQKLPRGEFALERGAFHQKAHYQVRIAALDRSGKVVGSVSDPVSIDLTQ